MTRSFGDFTGSRLKRVGKAAEQVAWRSRFAAEEVMEYGGLSEPGAKWDIRFTLHDTSERAFVCTFMCIDDTMILYMCTCTAYRCPVRVQFPPSRVLERQTSVPKQLTPIQTPFPFHFPTRPSFYPWVSCNFIAFEYSFPDSKCKPGYRENIANIM